MTMKLAVCVSGALIPLSWLYVRHLFPDPDTADLNHFTALFRALTYLAVSLLLWAIMLGVRGSTGNAESGKRPAGSSLAKLWSLGYVFVILGVLDLAVTINPHAIFDRPTLFPVFPAARNLKQDLYQNLEDAPQIVIMGSSRAFTISPAYVEQLTGYRAFNFSVEGGRATDFMLESRLILQMEHQMLPNLFLIELGYVGEGGEWAAINLQPFSMLRYMAPGLAVRVIGRRSQEIFSLSSVSDASFLLGNPQLRPEDAAWVFQMDGLGVREPISEAQYQSGLRRDAAQFKKGFECSALDPEWEKYIGELVSTAETHRIAILFYTSPVNATFYRQSMFGNEAYYRCHQLIIEYMDNLTAKYPSASFRDLEGLEEIMRLRQAGFYDILHLKPAAANAVVDALAPQIQAAYAWSVAQR